MDAVTKGPTQKDIFRGLMKDARITSGVSAVKVSKKIGVNPLYLYRVEAGRWIPPGDILLAYLVELDWKKVDAEALVRAWVAARDELVVKLSRRKSQ